MNIIPAAWVSEIRPIQGVSLLYCIYTEFVLCSGVDMISQSNTGGLRCTALGRSQRAPKSWRLPVFERGYGLAGPMSLRFVTSDFITTLPYSWLD